MAEKKDDGGAAFARATEQTVMGFNGTLEGERGMTLLDYFAGQIATGHAAIPDERRCPSERHHEADKWRKEIMAHDAIYCYDMAQAMIDEKRRREQA